MTTITTTRAAGIAALTTPVTRVITSIRQSPCGCVTVFGGPLGAWLDADRCDQHDGAKKAERALAAEAAAKPARTSDDDLKALRDALCGA